MPNKQSAKRRVRIAERNRVYNRYWTTRCRNAVKKVLEAVEAKDGDAATKNFDLAQSVIDKAVVKGVMHRNTATRRKKMMALRVKSLRES
ncbi:MAG: 30S ribosomal protein S20 [Fretibacterium sp.]|uniref:30S ribosomal protein S20 n=1 Tax=Fretibacterium sp. OH1220_COT-178 TaxID=2491047 RepID=UPI000F5FC889|nr:30S ribosomal protein S20 [Fretibacterium sp. OH1220_COT-178]MDO4786107.1 30S ribosomal protein S20 [Fretibacterium sp.]RRD66262.1 30S ribosomal protein S20 [Fretibacterium sp. OH1220_COT-178]